MLIFVQACYLSLANASALKEVIGDDLDMIVVESLLVGLILARKKNMLIMPPMILFTIQLMKYAGWPK